MVFLWLSLLTALIWYLWYYWQRRHLYRLSRNVPGPKGWPLIGNALDFTGGTDETFSTITKFFSEHPNLRKIWFGPLLVYGVSKPEYLEKILTSPHALSKNQLLCKHLVPLIGNGLFTASVPIWKRHRKIIMPAFNQKVLDGFVEVFSQQSTIMGKQLEVMVETKEFDLYTIVSPCFLDIICETAMGVRVNAQTEYSSFGESVDRLFEIMFLRIYVVWYHFDPIFKWTQLYRDNCQLTERYKAFISKVIAEKMSKRGTTKVPKRKAFLDLLIELPAADNKLTEEEIRDEVSPFMIAGSDTTANTVSFVLVMLALHPEIQSKVYEEVVDVLGSTRVVESEDLPHLIYTERVVKETMRLFPIGAFFVRDITGNIPLQDGVVLPKASIVILSIFAVHRNGGIWPDPLKFDPDRFLPEGVTKRHPFAYLPFSGVHEIV